ncbi:MAG TPA: hypothetical protein EYP69_05995 [Bacteroidales bacterium]|nr:hypothetical protein [Bacteroidales bacterium]
MTILIFTACNRAEHPVEKTKARQSRIALKKGEVVTENIFSYYLPTTYAPAEKLPVFFIFDPHGHGELPLARYYSLAEKYNFILVASNVSKNGLPRNQLNNIIEQFFRKVSFSISFDSNKVFVMGFSGGARVSSIAAVTYPAVQGMVLCGGGLAYQQLIENIKSDVLLLVGKEDFNLPELMNLDTLLDNKCRHLLLHFDGHHQWPDLLTMEDVFLWAVFKMMKNGAIPVKDTLVRNFLAYNDSLFKNISDMYDKKMVLDKIIYFTNTLMDITKYKQQIRYLERCADYKKEMKKFLAIIKKEQEQEQSLSESMLTQSFEWWHATIQMIISDSSQKTLPAMSHKRILNYLSLVAYMQSTGALESQRNNYAGHFIGLYQLIDPDNPEGYYLEAQLAVRKNNPKAAIAALKKAEDLGFSDFDRLNNDLEFMPLLNTVEYQELLDKIRK